MIPSRIIEKAIEGGWLHLSVKTQTEKEIGKEWAANNSEKTILDPAFWVALGKALGWDNPDVPSIAYWTMEGKSLGKITLLDNWQNVAHSFFDLILGGDTEAFWEEIYPSKK